MISLRQDQGSLVDAQPVRNWRRAQSAARCSVLLCEEWAHRLADLRLTPNCRASERATDFGTISALRLSPFVPSGNGLLWDYPLRSIGGHWKAELFRFTLTL